MTKFALALTWFWIFVLFVYRTAWQPRWERFNAWVVRCRAWIVKRLEPPG